MEYEVCGLGAGYSEKMGCLGKPAITSKTSVKLASSVGSVGMDLSVGLEGSLSSSPNKKVVFLKN